MRELRHVARAWALLHTTSHACTFSFAASAPSLARIAVRLQRIAPPIDMKRYFREFRKGGARTDVRHRSTPACPKGSLHGSPPGRVQRAGRLSAFLPSPPAAPLVRRIS